MRIIVTGQPKTGNVWVKHLLAFLYRLQIVDGELTGDPAALQRFVAGQGFAESTIFHQHYWPEAGVLELARRESWHLVTPLRNPYDAFVSLYFHLQARGDAFRRTGDPAAMLIGRPFEHPDVDAFIRDHFGRYLDLSRAWIASGATHLVRYEELHRAPRRELWRLAAQISPVGPFSIARAVRAAQADRLKRRGGDYAIHIRTATVGDWKHHLTARNLDIFHTCHANAIRELGYTVEQLRTSPASCAPGDREKRAATDALRT